MDIPYKNHDPIYIVCIVYMTSMFWCKGISYDYVIDAIILGLKETSNDKFGPNPFTTLGWLKSKLLGCSKRMAPLPQLIFLF